MCCPVLPEAEEIRVAESELAETSTLVQEVWDESDTVLLARIESVVEKDVRSVETVEANEDDAVIVGQLVHGDVLATTLDVLKGEAKGEVRLRYRRDETKFERSCTGVLGFRKVYLLESYRYLLYVRDGKILRANMVVDWFEDLDADDEMELLKAHQPAK